MNKNNVLIDRWVTNFLAIFLALIFGAVILVTLALSWNQIVWHSGDPGSYASEFTGILNSIIMIGIGVFFTSVVGKLLGMRNDDVQKNIEQTSKISKEIGLSAVAEQHDRLQESPNTDEEK